LKRFLYHHSFYSMNEYYQYKEDRRIWTLRGWLTDTLF
jgi:hypothetical protein